MALPHHDRSNPVGPHSNGRHSSSAEAEQLRQRMATVRSDLQRDIAGVSQDVQEAKHWQFYVKRFPFVCTGAAVLLGYSLIPAKRPASIVATDDQIKDLADAGKLHIVSQPVPKQNASLSQRAVLALGTVAARAGMAYIGKVIGQQAKTDD